MRATVVRASRFEGRASVPGDKSLSHRAVLLGALASGVTRVRGLAGGADVRSSLACVRQLGVQTRQDGDEAAISSPGREGWQQPHQPLDCGNSGTTARLLMGMLAPSTVTARLIGDASLSRRPMRRVAQPLASMSAQIHLSNAGSLPATVQGSALIGRSYVLDVASAQVKTALLLAGLGAQGETQVREPAPSRDHTENMLPLFGAMVRREESGVSVGRTSLSSPDLVLDIPGDPSSVAFLAVAAALVARGEVVVDAVGLNPLRTGAFQVLREMGARCEEQVTGTACGEPVGRVVMGGGLNHPLTASGALIPRLVDELPVLAVAAALAPGTSVIRDADELRVKESDRIAAVVAGLQAMGAQVQELPDGLIVEGGRPLRGAVIDAHHDHRIAMAFTVAGLVADGETVIRGAEWADISFPGFFALMNRLSGGSVRVDNE